MKSELKQYVAETKSKIAEDILKRFNHRIAVKDSALYLRALVTGAMFAAAHIEPHVDQADMPIEGTPVFLWLNTICMMEHEFEMTEMLKAAL